MKNRDKFIPRVLIVVAVIFFIVGYIVSANFLNKPSNECQLDFYQEVARYVYEHGDQVIVEAPDDLIISKTATTITVKSKFGFVGKVDAKLKDGELVFTRVAGTGESIFSNILLGILFVLIYTLSGSLIFGIYVRIKKKEIRKMKNE